MVLTLEWSKQNRIYMHSMGCISWKNYVHMIEEAEELKRQSCAASLCQIFTGLCSTTGWFLKWYFLKCASHLSVCPSACDRSNSLVLTFPWNGSKTIPVIRNTQICHIGWPSPMTLWDRLEARDTALDSTMLLMSWSLISHQSANSIGFRCSTRLFAMAQIKDSKLGVPKGLVNETVYVIFEYLHLSHGKWRLFSTLTGTRVSGVYAVA